MVAGHLQEKKGIYYMVLNFTDENGKRKPKWISTKLPVKGNKRRAELMLQEERKKYTNSSPLRLGSDMMFADYMLYWLKIAKHEVDISTYAGYKSVVENRIVPYFRQQNVTLQNLKAADIKAFYTHCLENTSVGNNTVIHYHANISNALNHAVQMDMIPTTPLKKGLRPKKVRHNSQFYTLTETEHLIKVVQGDPIEFPVLMAAFYGLRREEVMGLQWSNIDLLHNTITISHTVVQINVDGKSMIIAKDRTKNQSSYRTLPLVPQFRELLLYMKAHQEKCKILCGDSYFESDYIYVNDVGIPYKPNYVTQHFALVIKKHGLRKITFHELRHTCASLLLKNKVPMKDIQAWLGHSDFNTTANIYAHLESDSKTESGAAMVENLDISATLSTKQLLLEAGENLGENRPKKHPEI